MMVLIGQPGASATYQLDAKTTILNPVTALTSFHLTFNDLDNDLMVSDGEVTSFSGIMKAAVFYPSLAFVGQVAGFADGISHDWLFAGGGGITGVDPSFFTYKRTLLSGSAAVPLPAPALLLAGGLAGLVAVSRRRKRANLA